MRTQPGFRVELAIERLFLRNVSPIAYFFRLLAQAEKSSSVGVILSGNGSDGTAGLQEKRAK